jgi:glucose-6-phosphate 1-dehydrogenase
MTKTQNDPLLNCLLPVIYILLGGSGDLSSRHLLPSLYGLWKAGKLPPKFLIIGSGLILWSNEQYREKILEQMIARGFVKPNDWHEFSEHLEWHYLNLDENDPIGYLELKRRLIQFDDQCGGNAKWIYYCAITPKYFAPVIESLAQAQMLVNKSKQIIALEKPFAANSSSAQELYEAINKYCQPEQVVCIEHYALKPMAQALPQFVELDPIMDSFQPDNLKQVEVIANESIGVNDQRLAFYESCPATLDMHSHLLIPMLSQFIVSLQSRYR